MAVRTFLTEVYTSTLGCWSEWSKFVENQLAQNATKLYPPTKRLHFSRWQLYTSHSNYRYIMRTYQRKKTNANHTMTDLLKTTQQHRSNRRCVHVYIPTTPSLEHSVSVLIRPIDIFKFFYRVHRLLWNRSFKPSQTQINEEDSI